MRFDGAIAGLGTTSGVRLVIGIWPASPFGPIADVMIERPDGRRTLLAPNQAVADFIAATYRFDDTRVETTSVRSVARGWRLDFESLSVSFEIGHRTAAGWALSLVPRRLARARWWCRLINPAARWLRRGVRTFGSGGGGRTEYYCALDEQSVTAVHATLDGVNLGPLADIAPPVQFGFSSTPRRPSLVRVTTLIDDGPNAQAVASARSATLT